MNYHIGLSSNEYKELDSSNHRFSGNALTKVFEFSGDIAMLEKELQNSAYYSSAKVVNARDYYNEVFTYEIEDAGDNFLVIYQPAGADYSNGDLEIIVCDTRENLLLSGKERIRRNIGTIIDDNPLLDRFKVFLDDKDKVNFPTAQDDIYKDGLLVAKDLHIEFYALEGGNKQISIFFSDKDDEKYIASLNYSTNPEEVFTLVTTIHEIRGGIIKRVEGNQALDGTVVLLIEGLMEAEKSGK